ncbi:MAG: response regulator, partial [Candidatus Omnitrophica bacterium]|nr:response regulator [Candidatus Omnitrophota bacterium]
MIVDDNRELLDEVDEVLRGAGYRTVKAAESEKVVSIARAERPDVILMDLKMSPKTGFQLADELGCGKDTAGIPVISMSAVFTREEDRLLGDACGIKAWLEKPFNPLDVIALIEKVLGDT